MWRELHRRLGASDRAVTTISVELDDAAAVALSALLGQASRLPRGRTRLRVAKLRDALGVDDAGLRAVVERLVGPLENRARARADAIRAREGLWRALQARIGAVAPRTMDRLRTSGVASGDDLDAFAAAMDTLAGVLEALPLDQPSPAPILAWELLGDPHGLDSDSVVHRWLTAAVAERAGLEGVDTATHEVREAARASGIVFDRLSTPTLTWGLRAEPSTPAGRLLELCARDRTPVHLTTAILDRGTPELLSRRVLCVENPSVIEWLHLTDRPVPAVCTSGWPSTDAQRLLSTLREQGVGVDYAGDYDATGLAIANLMRERFGVTVQMTAQAYRAARRELAPAWQGEVPATPWCPALRRAIEEVGVIVYQEDTAILAALAAGR